jgi:hypothetical protein
MAMAERATVVIVVAPALLLALASLLRSVPGEWSQSALLAWAAVAAAYLAGGAGGAGAPLAQTAVGLGLAFAALATGGAWGLLLLTAMSLAATAAALAGGLAVAWPATALLAAACALGAARDLIH